MEVLLWIVIWVAVIAWFRSNKKGVKKPTKSVPPAAPRSPGTSLFSADPLSAKAAGTEHQARRGTRPGAPLRGHGDGDLTRPSLFPPAPLAPSPVIRSTPQPSPPTARERAPQVRREPEPWRNNSGGIPFARTGLRGPLFSYGGTSLRDGFEHDGPYAVVDFETTGLSPRSDRIIEIAIARVDGHGRVEDEFATLINPGRRDVGPTFIHGITNQQVADAPTFEEVLPDLLARINGAVVVAHNATFEEAFLAAELKRAGQASVRVPALCTLWLGRQTFSTPNHRLGTIARAAGVPLVDKHAALGDVRAVSALLPQMLRKVHAPIYYPVAATPWQAPALKELRLVTRAVALRKGSDGWMHSLVSRLPQSGLSPDDASAEEYLDALAEAMSDGKIVAEEARYLADLAGSAGMGGEQVVALNRRFLDSLLMAAQEDGALSRSEVRELNTAAKALSLPGHFEGVSPTSIATEVISEQPGTAAGPGTLTREARQSRGTNALKMQRSGSSRAEIALALGVSEATVKSVLRDAKFYENPESDPSRLALAQRACSARSGGLTREEFQRDETLSTGKSTEAWRDAVSLPDEHLRSF